VTEPGAAPFKRMRLRYAGACRGCGAALPAGQTALYYRVDKQVECISCFDRASQPDAPGPGSVPGMSSPAVAAGSVVEVPREVAQTETGIDQRPVAAQAASGTAGASARREHQRRVAKREDRIRTAHPRLGGFILAVTDEPQSTRAWERGAVGEEKLANSLDGLLGRGAQVLHDRRIPGSRANIDHIVIAPAGVFVIDAKRYKGRPHLRVEGGIIRPRVETLMVGRRDCSKLVTGVRKQVEHVATALAAAGVSNVPPVRGMLCFIDAEWPLFGGAFTTSEIDVLWPKKIAERVLTTQNLNADQVSLVHTALATHFPQA
jgi:hypothetical protein